MQCKSKSYYSTLEVVVTSAFRYFFMDWHVCHKKRATSRATSSNLKYRRAKLELKFL